MNNVLIDMLKACDIYRHGIHGMKLCSSEAFCMHCIPTCTVYIWCFLIYLVAHFVLTVTGELQRKIGLKVLETGGNAVIG